LINKSNHDCGNNCGGCGVDVSGDIDSMVAMVVNVPVLLWWW